MIVLTKKGFKMMNYSLAGSNKVTLEHRPAQVWLLRGHGMLRQVVIMLKQWDQKAQVFFDAQATTRAQDGLEAQWGFDLDSGF